MRDSFEIQREAAAQGFQWPSLNDAIRKVREELAELEACAPGTENFSDELGDVLFAAIGLAVRSGVNPFHALNLTNEKFRARYQWVSQQLRALPPGVADFSAMSSLWQQAKAIFQAPESSSNHQRRAHPTVAVVGKWDERSAFVLDQAFALGQQLARAGITVFTGGGPGVMSAACAGAQSEGGLTVGLLGTVDRENESSPYLDITIPTGLGWDVRSALLVRCTDALILLGGGNGSLQELTMAYMAEKPILVLKGSGGWADRLEAALYDGHYLDERHNVRIQYVEDVGVACARALEACHAGAANKQMPVE